MRLLLDTNILIPIANGAVSTLRHEMEAVLRAPGSTLFVSVAGLWEIAIKFRLGKLQLAVPPAALPAVFEEFGLTVLEVRVAHVLADVDPLPDTRDPFDQLLLGICASEDMRLVTTDRILRDHPLAWRTSA